MDQSHWATLQVLAKHIQVPLYKGVIFRCHIHSQQRKEHHIHPTFISQPSSIMITPTQPELRTFTVCHEAVAIFRGNELARYLRGGYNTNSVMFNQFVDYLVDQGLTPANEDDGDYLRCTENCRTIALVIQEIFRAFEKKDCDKDLLSYEAQGNVACAAAFFADLYALGEGLIIGAEKIKSTVENMICSHGEWGGFNFNLAEVVLVRSVMVAGTHQGGSYYKQLVCLIHQRYPSCDSLPKAERDQVIKLHTSLNALFHDSLEDWHPDKRRMSPIINRYSKTQNTLCEELCRVARKETMRPLPALEDEVFLFSNFSNL
ncbi:hypothetical protein DFP72DRAFT_1093307 [Ephemerocybe angulata]|uniref:Uncharacterized protein n=1 Tax=Ephemerocybe angulata TaxID=980116 RepID=A0A8H6HCW8_9AGAR|nr:hypothetical protein DFP72DRAFT_1093307 [Tulosesus angulatus]